MPLSRHFYGLLYPTDRQFDFEALFYSDVDQTPRELRRSMPFYNPSERPSLEEMRPQGKLVHSHCLAGRRSEINAQLRLHLVSHLGCLRSKSFRVQLELRRFPA